MWYTEITAAVQPRGLYMVALFVDDDTRWDQITLRFDVTYSKYYNLGLKIFFQRYMYVRHLDAFIFKTLSLNPSAGISILASLSIHS